MRPFALSALLLVAAVGCGVPQPPTDSAKPTDTQTGSTTGKSTTTGSATGSTTATVSSTTGGDKTTAGATATTGTTASTGTSAGTPPKPEEPDPAKLGLKITDKKIGTGAVAENGDTCYLLYTGRLKNGGKIFDSTAKNNDNPFAFQLGMGTVIKGWDLGVKGMKVGGSRTLDIPADLAYGSSGQGADIPPNSDLIFDVQLLYVMKPADAHTVVRTEVKPGTGRAAKNGDTVTIDYTGTLVNGHKFDSSKDQGKPLTFKLGLGEVIPGFDLGVLGMKKGGKRSVTIPPELGYGPMGREPVIPPNSVLKFDITLLDIK